jgi:hypothetical protein
MNCCVCNFKLKDFESLGGRGVLVACQECASQGVRLLLALKGGEVELLDRQARQRARMDDKSLVELYFSEIRERKIAGKKIKKKKFVDSY